MGEGVYIQSRFGLQELLSLTEQQRAICSESFENIRLCTERTLKAAWLGHCFSVLYSELDMVSHAFNPSTQTHVYAVSCASVRLSSQS